MMFVVLKVIDLMNLKLKFDRNQQNSWCRISSHHDQKNLLVNFSAMLGYQFVIQITAWDRGIQWSYIQQEKVEECDWKDNPKLLIFPFLNEPKAQEWIEMLPPTVLSVILEFEKIYPDLTFPALWFLSRYPRAIDLLLSYPLLLALILYRAQIDAWDEETIIRLFSAKRIHILAVCGLHGTKGNVRLLKKLAFAHFGLKEYNLLLKSQHLPTYTELGRLNYLDFSLLEFLNLSPGLASSPLFGKYNAKWPWREFRLLQTDIFRMARQLSIQNIRDMIFSCRGFDALSHLHDKLMLRINKKAADSLPLFKYPPPPIMGTDNIIPITDSRQLCLEGETQHHCVASFHREIKRKRYYVYKITGPERATLGILIKPGNKIQIDQLKLRYNAEPSDRTRSLITRWLFEAECNNPDKQISQVQSSNSSGLLDDALDEEN